MEFLHKPVLFDECMEMLDIKPDGIYVDGTMGGGGHSEGILNRLDSGLLIGIDRDIEALNASQKRLDKFGNHVVFINNNYINIKEVLKSLDKEKVDGILLDLGVSSYQLDNPDRGFSYNYDAPLDMRMNTNDEITAKDVVNKCTKEELIKILRDYGEEKWASRIADFIVKKRESGEIQTTFELVDIIKAAIPAKAREGGGHPAKRTFQAIRIHVNKELEYLEMSVRNAIDSLKVGGRLCIITFHSLEDRIVKDVFNEYAKGCICPKEFPQCVCNNKPEVKVLTKKPIISKQEELEVNNRAHSAKLRVIEKL